MAVKVGMASVDKEGGLRMAKPDLGPLVGRQFLCHFPSEFHYPILDGPAVHLTFTGMASSILRRIEDITLLSFTQPPSL